MQSGRSANTQPLWWLALAAAAGYLLYLLGPILTPFLFAAILAYICNPLVDRMERRGVRRTLACALVLLLLFALFVILLLVLLPLLIRQFRALVEQGPVYIDWAKSVAQPWLTRLFGAEIDVKFIRDWMSEHSAELQGWAVKLLPSLKTGGLALLEIAVNLVLIPVVLFYFLRDWHRMLARLEEMIPRRWHGRAVEILTEIDDVLGQFLRGQLLVMLLMALFYTVGLWLAGLDYALSVGIISGLLTFVPFLGVITGVVLATVTGLLQFHDPSSLLWVWAVFVVANVLEGYVFVPWLVGERVGLHPVSVIFALLAFGQLFGFFGVLLAVPATAVLVVWLRYIRRTYLNSGAYNA
jgi:predicted PurR-regulated permease PerM